MIGTNNDDDEQVGKKHQVHIVVKYQTHLVLTLVARGSNIRASN